MLTPAADGELRTAYTDDTGSYQFSDLAAGSYRIEQPQPAAFLDGGPNELSVQITTGQQLAGQDFREQRTSSGVRLQSALLDGRTCRSAQPPGRVPFAASLMMRRWLPTIRRNWANSWPSTALTPLGTPPAYSRSIWCLSAPATGSIPDRTCRTLLDSYPPNQYVWHGLPPIQSAKQNDSTMAAGRGSYAPVGLE